MKQLKTILLALAMLLLSSTALMAATADATWTLPTTWVETGGTIDNTSKSQMVTHIEVSNDGLSGWSVLYNSAPGETSKTGIAITVGQGETKYFRFNVSLNGKNSAYSTVISSTLAYLTPGAPTGTSIILRP